MSITNYPLTIVITDEEALRRLAGAESIPLDLRAALAVGRDRRIVVTTTDLASNEAKAFVAAMKSVGRKVQVVYFRTARRADERMRRWPADEAVAAAIFERCPIGIAVLLGDASTRIDLAQLRARYEDCDDRWVAESLGLDRAGGATSVIVRSLARPGRMPRSGRLLLVEQVTPTLRAQVLALPGAYDSPPQRSPKAPLPGPVPAVSTVAVRSGASAVHAPLQLLKRGELRSIVAGDSTDFLPLVCADNRSLDDVIWRAHVSQGAPDAPMLWIRGVLRGACRVWGVGSDGQEYGVRPTLAPKPGATVSVGLALVRASMAEALEQAATQLDRSRLVQLEGATFVGGGYELADLAAFNCRAALLDSRQKNRLLPVGNGDSLQHAEDTLFLNLSKDLDGDPTDRLILGGHARELGWPALDGVAALHPVELA